jgi:hypothetical protein
MVVRNAKILALITPKPLPHWYKFHMAREFLFALILWPRQSSQGEDYQSSPTDRNAATKSVGKVD